MRCRYALIIISLHNSRSRDPCIVHYSVRSGSKTDSFACLGPDLAPDVGYFQSDAVLGSFANVTGFSVTNNVGGLLGGSANEGQILFFQNGEYYVGDAGPAAGNPLTAQSEINFGGPQVNNRAYGVIGEGRSDFICGGIYSKFRKCVVDQPGRTAWLPSVFARATITLFRKPL